MSAVINAGDFIIDLDPQWDPDKEQFGCNGGVKSRTGKMMLHFTAWGVSKEQAINRARDYCRIMTVFKPPTA